MPNAQQVLNTWRNSMTLSNPIRSASRMAYRLSPPWGPCCVMVSLTSLGSYSTLTRHRQATAQRNPTALSKSSSSWPSTFIQHLPKGFWLYSTWCNQQLELECRGQTATRPYLDITYPTAHPSSLWRDQLPGGTVLGVWTVQTGLVMNVKSPTKHCQLAHVFKTKQNPTANCPEVPKPHRGKAHFVPLLTSQDLPPILSPPSPWQPVKQAVTILTLHQADTLGWDLILSYDRVRKTYDVAVCLQKEGGKS